MSQSRDDDEARRPRRPGDHVVMKLDASRSQALRSLTQNALIVEEVAGRGVVLTSMLRALLGRDVETRLVLGSAAALAEFAADAPRMIFWRCTGACTKDAIAGISDLRQTGFLGPIIAVVEELDAREAASLRIAGVTDVLMSDDLDSVRLSQMLLKVLGVPQPFRTALLQ